MYCINLKISLKRLLLFSCSFSCIVLFFFFRDWFSLHHIMENDDTLWPPLTKGKGRKEKKSLVLVNKAEVVGSKVPISQLFLTLFFCDPKLFKNLICENNGDQVNSTPTQPIVVVQSPSPHWGESKWLVNSERFILGQPLYRHFSPRILPQRFTRRSQMDGVLNPK